MSAAGGSEGEGSARASGLTLWQRFKAAAKKLKHEVLALHFAMQDPQTDWVAKMFAAAALAYALSPLDLIPDFIPVLGLVDDLVIVPGLLLLACYFIPASVMARARERAALEPLRLSRSWGMAALVFACWDALALWLARVALQRWPVLGAAWSWVALAALAAVLVACEAGWLVLQLRRERRREALAACVLGRDAFTEALIAADGRDPEDP